MSLVDMDYLDALRSDPCSYCDQGSVALDHIDAQARGGSDHWSNFTATCKRCNSRKGARSLLTFLRMPPQRRDRRCIQIFLDAQDRAALRRLAAANGTSMAEQVRHLIEKAAA